jgi:hypothetical protein
MQSSSFILVEVDPFVLWQLLPEEQRPGLAPQQLDLFEDLVYVSSGAEKTYGGPWLSFDGVSVSITADGYRLLLAQRLRLLVWSPLTVTGNGTLSTFLDLCKARTVSREELASETSKMPDVFPTILLFRFSRALLESEAEIFRLKISAAIEFGETRGHSFGQLEFRDGRKVAAIDAYLKWEDRDFGGLIFQAMVEFDLEVCPIVGFKGTEFFNPLRVAS